METSFWMEMLWYSFGKIILIHLFQDVFYIFRLLYYQCLLISGKSVIWNCFDIQGAVDIETDPELKSKAICKYFPKTSTKGRENRSKTSKLFSTTSPLNHHYFTRKFTRRPKIQMFPTNEQQHQQQHPQQQQILNELRNI